MDRRERDVYESMAAAGDKNAARVLRNDDAGMPPPPPLTFSDFQAIEPNNESQQKDEPKSEMDNKQEDPKRKRGASEGKNPKSRTRPKSDATKKGKIKPTVNEILTN